MKPVYKLTGHRMGAFPYSWASPGIHSLRNFPRHLFWVIGDRVYELERQIGEK